MNVLILGSSLSFGGAEKQAVIDANLLSEGHTVFLGTFKDGPLRGQLKSDVKHILIKKDNYIFTIIRLTRIIRQHNIEIIHASLFAAMVIAGFASFITKIPVVWHFHSHEYDIPILHKYILKLVSKFSNVKKVLFVNQELKEYFYQKFGFTESKLDILYNTSLIKNVQPERNDTNIIKIGYVGRIVELKRVNYLIDLARYLKKKNVSFMIHIVGDGAERNNVEGYGKKLQVDDQIKFWGFQKNVEKFYDMFDLFVLPSREECLSIALIDAAMKGIPAVAFGVGGNDEIVINGKTGYIVHTKEEMFDKISLLVSNKDLRNKLGGAARLHAMRLFSEEAHKKAMDKVYESIFG